MLPAVGFAGHDNGVVRGITNDAAARVVGHIGKRIVWLVAAVPDFFCRNGCDVGEPDGPRMRTIGLDKIAFRRVARNCGLADKGDALAVERPLGNRIAVHAWREKFYGLLLRVVDSDKTVVATAGSEGEKFSVGRPFGFAVMAARDDLQWLCAAIERREIKLAVASVGDHA